MVVATYAKDGLLRNPGGGRAVRDGISLAHRTAVLLAA